MGKVKELVNGVKLNEIGVMNKERMNDSDYKTYKIKIDSIGSVTIEKRYIDYFPISGNCEVIKLQEIIKFAYSVYQQEKNELKNYFEENEVSFILDTFNGYMLGDNFSYCKDRLIFNISDSIEYRKADEKYGIDKDRVINKIKTLTNNQAVVLILMIQEYWQSEEDKTIKLMKEIFY